jgi:5-methylcytosine-specific restriction endonuclease McrBC regulatory subunit McrC
MLCKVLEINVVNLDFSTGKEDIHDFFFFLFPSYLQNALSQGLFKQYKRKQYNDANVKGAIDINRHIKMNIPFTGKIAYTTREHSHDNDITQLIRHTIEHLRTRTFGHSILTNNANIRANVSQIEYATTTYKKGDLQKVIKANMRAVNHPYFTKYRDLQKLCLQILSREKTTFGEKNKVHGLLFDGAWLWEEYVATILKEKGIEHRTERKGSDKLFIDEENNKEVQPIVPDFIRPCPGKNKAFFIGDAKYKHIDKKWSNREDYFQIITYMFRYLCSTGYLIFPYDKDNEYVKRRSINNGTDYEVVELGLKIPQNAEKFDVFCKEIKKNEDSIVEVLWGANGGIRIC